MASQNRSYARQSGGTSRSLAFFRGAFVLLTALTLSFSLGFFVIARMMPQSGSSDGSGGSQNAGITDDSKKKLGAAAPAVQPDPIKPDKPSIKASGGPKIEPDDSVQKADKVDHSDATSTKPGDTSLISPGDDSGDGTDSTKPKRDKSGAGDTAASGNDDGAGKTTPTDTAAGDDGKVKKGLFHVQIGIYSTRAKAEEVASAATDKGIAAGVHVITRDGRTLYRVQHSARKDRAKAEIDLKMLLDAGFDASIVGPN